MKTKIKVTVEYIGAWSRPGAQEYRITKLVGAVVVSVAVPNGEGITNQYRPARVGDVIHEAQAIELADRVELTTLPRKD